MVVVARSSARRNVGLRWRDRIIDTAAFVILNEVKDLGRRSTCEILHFVQDDRLNVALHSQTGSQKAGPPPEIERNPLERLRCLRYPVETRLVGS
jgi:hypothetical protein